MLGRRFWTVVLASLGSFSGGCSDDAAKTTAPSGPIYASIDIAIAGMHCDGCATSVGDALKETDGVVECQVSFERKRATIKYDPARVTPAQLAAVIERTGYKPTLPGATPASAAGAESPAPPTP